MSRNSSKVMMIIALALIAAVLFVGCNKGNEEETALTEVKIGGVYPLSGNVAVYGIEARNGVDLAIAEINANGGILGVPVNHLAEDDEGSADKSVNAFKKLNTQDGVKLFIGSLTSGCTKAIAPLAQAKKVVQIAPAATADDVTSFGNFIFRVCYNDSFQGTVCGQFAAQDLGAKKAAVLYDNANDYSVGLFNNFKAAFEANGGTIVSAQSYTTNDVDFSAQLTTIKNTTPDVVFLPDYYQTVSLIAKQLRDSGITAPIVGADGWEGLTENAGDEVLNGFYSNHYASDTGDEMVNSFVANFENAYGSVPTGFAALAYDAVYVLRDAIEACGSVDPVKVQAALEKVEGKYVTGYLKFNELRNPIKSAVMLEIVKKDGKLTTAYKTTVSPNEN